MGKFMTMLTALAATSLIGVNATMAATNTNEATTHAARTTSQSHHVVQLPNKLEVSPSRLTYTQETNWIKSFIKRSYKVTNEGLFVQEFHSSKGNYFVGYAFVPKAKTHLLYFVNESMTTSPKQLQRYIGNEQDFRIISQALGLD